MASASFLQDKLPLKPVSSTPVELIDPKTKNYSPSGNQALTVVFSRPVIALGSDFGVGDTLPPSLVPFNINCPVPGLFRWVTTSIARWDPTIDWPPDLNCEFKWNTGLKAYDGTPLDLAGAPASVKITTSPMTITVGNINSTSANQATDNQWNAQSGLPDDNLPEVPADGNITLLFSYPVVFSTIANSFKLVDCCNASNAAGRKVEVFPCPDQYSTPSPLPLGVASNGPPANATCAVVRITPPLPPQGGVAIRLPKGSKYNPNAGALSTDTDVKVYGLRKFRIPLNPYFQQLTNSSDTFTYYLNGIQYKRMLMWLPHGLAEGTKVQDIQKLIKICVYKDPYKWESYCTSLTDFKLTRPNKGTLLFELPSMKPRHHYHLTIAGNPKIKDAYGLPLIGTEAYFFSSDLQSAFQGPVLSQGGSLMLVESPRAQKGGKLASQGPWQWPLVGRGYASPVDTGDGATVTYASVWDVVGESDTQVALSMALNGNNPEPKSLGTPRATVQRPQSNETAKFTSLPMKGEPGAWQIVGDCCNLPSPYSNPPNVKVRAGKGGRVAVNAPTHPTRT